MRQSSEIVSYTRSLIGKAIDMDGVYGAQCMDLTVHMMKKFFGWHPSGNAIHLTTQAIPVGFQRFRVFHSSEIKSGDVLIWGLGSFATYGHTGATRFFISA